MTRPGAAPIYESGGHTWSWGGRLRRTSPALLDYCESRVVGLVRSAITRASTAARSASARFIPATRITARVSNSIRLAEIASHFASQELATAVFPARNAGCSSPVLPTRPVLITGVIPEEPVVTPSEAAGSGVLCGSVPEPSGTYCAAICAALRTGSAARHHFLKVMLAGHQGGQKPNLEPGVIHEGRFSPGVTTARRLTAGH